ncbi:TonB-dependent receptor [Ornithobacterium rhinotracheale]|uniref:TonB-dependent receptor n=1 Tax=Ornithobacterium rhinotracheale TaxID=28251 RepID=UPI00129CF8FD|nr:TonB-dependent receptor [Ornithobacterium rhinotracheale]MRI63286.1 TonB-dependent receptor [Ornithobacterium rhinotracheale]
MRKLLILCTLFSTTYLLAQEQPKHYELDSVLVQGKEKKTHQKATFVKNAQTTEVLSAYDLERTTPNMIEQSLGTLPGVQVDKRTHFGGQRVVLRGYGNDQKFNNWGVKFYLNGVPMTNADGTTILEDVDFSLINGVDVIKGPAGTLYGSGVGGVVKFNMNPTTQNGVTLSQNTFAGSYKTFGSTTRLDTASDNYSLLFSYGHLQSDGYRPRGVTNKNNYTFLGNFKLSPSQKIMVYATHNNSFQGVDGQISFDDYYARKDPGNGAYARREAHNHFIGTRAIVNHQWQITPNVSSNTSIFYHTLDTERVAAGAFETSEQPTYGARTEWTADYTWNSDFRTVTEFGAEYSISRPLLSNYRFAGSYDNPPFQTKDISKGSYFKYNNYAATFFLSNRWEYTPYKLALITGLSGNTLGYNRKDLLYFTGLLTKSKKDASMDKSFSLVVTPHIALQKEIAKNHILNLSYCEGYNAPTSATAYIKGLAKTNDDLKPEYAKMWDLSAQGTLAQNTWDYQISLFDMTIKDKLSKLSAQDSEGNPYSYFANTGVQTNKGMEFSLGYNYKNASFLRNIRPFANLSVYDFKYKDFKTSKEDFSGNKVVGVPSTKYTFGLDFDTEIGLYMRNTFSYLSDVYTDFQNTVKVDGFSQLNAKLGYKHKVGKWDFDAFLIGNNLTNQINYTFLFVGNAVGDNDPDNGYPKGTITDVNPGPVKAYFTGGLNIAYHF